MIERMLDILEVLERRPDGANIRELSDVLDMARSTVYRILNTLETRDVVKRDLLGCYVLGPRLLSYAANVVSSHGPDLVGIASPHLEKLSRATGEASKLSVPDGDAVLVIAVAHGSGEYGLNIKPGRRLPLHAGAASRVLLAHLPEADIERLLQGDLQRYTAETICDPADLLATLSTIRKQGWAVDKGEYSIGVMAVAAPVLNRQGKAIAAISVPFLHSLDPQRIAQLRAAVCTSAKAISHDIGDLKK